MTSLLARLLHRAPRAGHLTFTVYTRAQCGCCHKALDLLKNAQKRHRFLIEEVDVDGDPALAAKYGTAVPVVAVNGKIRFRGVVSPSLLNRLLLAEGRPRPSEGEKVVS
ncbi:MAG: glutaredoxin family protein [Isosphaerales bacterium]